MQRMTMMIRLKPEAIEEYKRIHAEVWPGVLETIASCNIRNYSIYLREPENLLFGYFEYHGSDYDADMRKMEADPVTQRWWTITDPMQDRLDSVAPGGKWAMLEEVFHTD